MSGSWQIRVYEQQRLVHNENCEGPLELGRQEAGEPGPFRRSPKGSCARLIIAELKATDISRKHVHLERQADGSMRVQNLSGGLPVGLENEPPLAPKSVRQIPLPLVLAIGKLTIRVQEAEVEPGGVHSLAEATVAPSMVLTSVARFPGLDEQSTDAGQRTRQLLQWLQTSMAVFQSAASSPDFFQKAAQAVVDMIGLDTGRVLILEHGQWQTRAFASGTLAITEDDWRPSTSVLNKVLREKRTFWELPDLSSGQFASLSGVNAVVATPLLAADGQCIGAIYGDRRQAGPIFGPELITEVEAMLVGLIASGVAAGMARMQQEQAALTARVQFEQFFTRELSEQLSLQPDLLEGRDAEVSLLFCDIRGFSRISERLGPQVTVQWIGDVMGVLSDCILAHRGVLVDYIGDELVAMWGAPVAQPDHARLACRAAIDMFKALPDLNRRWREVLREQMAAGIGINSGVARVGNTGSHRKFKYGPLGNTVNLASRVEGATKYLRSPILITGSTQRQLDADFRSRRLCQVRVVNIAEAVELHELADLERPDWGDLKQGYESALAAFEGRDFRRAARIISGLLEKWPDDGPSLLLLSRAAECLVQPVAEFDPVWELPGK